MTPAQKKVGKMLRSGEITPLEASILLRKLAVAYRASAEASKIDWFAS